MKKIYKIGIIVSAVLILFAINTSIVAYAGVAETSVYLGGTPIGVVAKCEGVLVESLADVISYNGATKPAELAGIKVGDYITRINSTKISCPQDVSKSIENLAGVSATVYLERGDEKLTLFINPVYDVIQNTKKLGLNVKNEIAGIGTLTFVGVNGKMFGGLGHPIFDNKSQKRDVFNKGEIYFCKIGGVVKGEIGKAGELRGSFKRENSIGEICKNNYSGIGGSAEAALYDSRPMIAVGNKNEVKTGKAYIYTTLKGCKPEKYEIEIVKTVKQTDNGDKGMVLHITDATLLAEAGGIVQGMSGSPIIQNGKLIGAVTHVFINDPTMGYGIYIENMF